MRVEILTWRIKSDGEQVEENVAKETEENHEENIIYEDEESSLHIILQLVYIEQLVYTSAIKIAYILDHEYKREPYTEIAFISDAINTCDVTDLFIEIVKLEQILKLALLYVLNLDECMLLDALSLDWIVDFLEALRLHTANS
ncbi:hypothetical protein L1887_14399 [Cichorium endivia]|nr:hypothetical protein L1887_14399 [Cichorium endivia]